MWPGSCTRTTHTWLLPGVGLGVRLEGAGVCSAVVALALDARVRLGRHVRGVKRERAAVRVCVRERARVCLYVRVSVGACP